MDIDNLDKIFRQKQWDIRQIEEFMFGLMYLQKGLDKFCRNYGLKQIELSRLFESEKDNIGKE